MKHEAREVPSDRRRKKKSGVIEHPPALRLHRRRRAGSPSERAAAPTQRTLLRAESRYYAAVPCPSFLPSFLPFCHFLTMYFPLLVSRANNGQKRGRNVEGEKGDPGGEGGKREEEKNR